MKNPQDIAETFCDYFSNVASDILGDEVLSQQSDFEHLQEFCRENCPDQTQFVIPSVDENFVYTQLAMLPISKAIGHDNIGAKVLKCAASVLSTHITRIRNMSISMAVFPKQWKCARVTPIFKGGDKSDMNCYRPISILPILSKILERHVYDSLYGFLSSNILLYDQQSGFRRHHSCQSVLIKICDYLLCIDISLA